jgi:hypothetical protein
MLQNPVKKQTKRLPFRDIKTFGYRHVNGVERCMDVEGNGRAKILHVNCIRKYFISLSTEACHKAFLC